ncbi:hypothetical protein CYLTODRAFT_325814, partial [Cylindrobasidium torrendii FP15055 ss-10]
IYFVGIVPGPKQPSLEEINGFLEPLVDELLAGWKDGFYITKTASWPFGCLVRVMLGPIIADLPAAAQLTGMSGHSSTRWCFYCDSTRVQSDDLNTAMPLRNMHDHRRHAEEWRTAASTAKAQECWDRNQVRWSELLRLPYFDPTKFTTLDDLHLFMHRLMERHLREIWGMDIALEQGLERSAQYMPAFILPVSPTINVPCQRRRTHIVTSRGIVAVPQVPAGLGARKPGRRRITRGGTVVLGAEILREVRLDMANIHAPAWVGRPPLHPGEKRWGKLTASQWYILCTFYLPMTLARLWGRKKDSHDPDEARQYRMLSNFMDLITAVRLATARVQTRTRVQEYQQTIERYLRDLLDLYGGTRLTPYQHLALHFGPLIIAWGPNKSWRCWAFERYNGLIGRLLSNNKFGA